MGRSESSVQRDHVGSRNLRHPLRPIFGMAYCLRQARHESAARHLSRSVDAAQSPFPMLLQTSGQLHVVLPPRGLHPAEPVSDSQTRSPVLLVRTRAASRPILSHADDPGSRAVGPTASTRLVQSASTGSTVAIETRLLQRFDFGNGEWSLHALSPSTIRLIKDSQGRPDCWANLIFLPSPMILVKISALRSSREWSWSGFL